MKITDIQWNIDMDEALERLDYMTNKEASKLLGISTFKYALMEVPFRHQLAEDKFHHCPALLEELMGLPNDIEVPEYLEGKDDEDISNWLSDTYGFCFDGYSLDVDKGNER